MIMAVLFIYLACNSVEDSGRKDTARLERRPSAWKGKQHTPCAHTKGTKMLHEADDAAAPTRDFFESLYGGH